MSRDPRGYCEAMWGLVWEPSRGEEAPPLTVFIPRVKIETLSLYKEFKKKKRVVNFQLSVCGVPKLLSWASWVLGAPERETH